MISLSWDSSFEPNSYDADRHISAMMKRYRTLPRHIAKKHLKAALRAVTKRGVPILRKNTPPLDTKRGRRKKGEKRRSTGALRRSVTVKTGQTGKNSDFDQFVWAVLGYKAGIESRKAIWLEFGTSNGSRAFRMMEKTVKEMGPIAASQLAREMAERFEKAVNEVAGKKNLGYGG